MTKKQHAAFYILVTIASLLFLAAAIPKLLDQPMAAAGFTVAHLPLWVMYAIGTLEILGVIGLWVRRTTVAAASGLFLIMMGAIVITAAYVSVAEAVLPLIVAILLAFVIDLGMKRDISKKKRA